MEGLLRYERVIYDTNCIVYYCFRIQEEDSTGRPVVVTGPHTQRARRITDILVVNKKVVCTLRLAWVEAEKVLVEALNRLVEEGYIQNQLQIPRAVPHALKFRLAKSLREGLSRMKAERWFVIDGSYVAQEARMEMVRTLYEQFARDPATRDRIPQYKTVPSNQDISLILFSGHARFPLLTNDREIYNFAQELAQHGFCEMIKAFPRVQFS